MYEIVDSMVCNKNSYFIFRFSLRQKKKKQNRSTKLVLIVAFILTLMTN